MSLWRNDHCHILTPTILVDTGIRTRDLLIMGVPAYVRYDLGDTFVFNLQPVWQVLGSKWAVCVIFHRPPSGAIYGIIQTSQAGSIPGNKFSVISTMFGSPQR